MKDSCKSVYDLNCGWKGLSFSQQQVITKAMYDTREKRKKDNCLKIRKRNVEMFDKLAKIAIEPSQISNLNNAIIVNEKMKKITRNFSSKYRLG